MNESPAPEVIDRFEGKYRFLSNFYQHKFTSLTGERWQSGEHAFQAAKLTPGLSRRLYLQIKQAASPGQAKRLGRQVPLRPDWEEIKVNIMRNILRAKFRDPELREMLLATGDAALVEGNYWYDTFWGVCNGRGQNWLGRLLMEVREEAREQDG